MTNAPRPTLCSDLPSWAAVVRYGYWPAIFFGLNGIGIALLASSVAAPAKATGLLTAFAAAIALSFGAERLLPYERRWNQSHGDEVRDWIHTAVNESLGLFPLLAASVAAPALLPAARAPWPGDLPFIAAVVFAIAVFDLGQTIFHYASHRSPVLWRLHAVHHQAERLYGLNGLIKHPLYQLLSSAAGTLPLQLLGAPGPVFVAVAFLSATQLIVQHSNVDYRTGAAKYVFAHAEVHRFHHLKGEAGDVNFALFFSIWDRLLGTAYWEDRKLGPGDVGLNDPSYPVEWKDQLLEPFRVPGREVRER